MRFGADLGVALRRIVNRGVTALFGDVGQEMTQEAPSAVQSRCNRADRGLREIGYLLRTEAFDVGVVDGGAKLVRQRAHRVPDLVVAQLLQCLVFCGRCFS